MSLLVEPARRRRAPSTGPVELRIELLWWLHPVVPVVLFGIVVSAAVAYASPDVFESWGVPKIFQVDHFEMVLVGALVMCVAALLPAARAFGRPVASLRLGPALVTRLQRLETQLFVLVLCAYVLWVLVAVRGGADAAMVRAVVDSEQGAVSSLKNVSAPVAGVTTFTQLAPVLVCVSVVLRRARRAVHPAFLWVVMALTLARALLYGERLALIEVCVPAVLLLAVIPPPGPPRARPLVRIVPLIGVPVLWAVFAAFEYTRSWAARNDGSHGTFTSYVTNRLLGYYGTSVNNSALYYEGAHGVPHLPLFPVKWVWDFPVLGDVARAVVGSPSLGGLDLASWWVAALRQASNPEFVNTGTFLVLAADLGTWGMVVYCAAIGLAVGALYAGVARGSLASLVAYACSFVGLLELARILYFGQGRFFVTALGLVWFAVACNRASRVDAAASPAEGEPGAGPPDRRHGLRGAR